MMQYGSYYNPRTGKWEGSEIPKKIVPPPSEDGLTLNQKYLIGLSLAGIAYGAAPPTGKKNILGVGAATIVGFGVILGNLYNWGRR